MPTAEIRFMVEEEDKAKIEAHAKELGVSVADFIRLLIKSWSGEITLERKNKPIEAVAAKVQ
jgi:hypothetical protein